MIDTLVYYHANCPDGFASATIANNILKDRANYIPLTHGVEFVYPQIDTANVYFLDYCPNPNIINYFISKNYNITIIDHHAPMREILDQFDNLNIIFNPNQSAATLTYNHFFPNRNIPLLLSLIEDRDCHFNKLNSQYPILLWLDTHPFVFPLWWTFINFSNDVYTKILSFNQPMVKKFNSIVQKNASNFQFVQLLDKFNCKLSFTSEELASDVALFLANSADIGISAVISHDNTVKISLRTLLPIDLNQIAKQLGGGGHPFAAAARFKDIEFYQMMINKKIII